MWTIASSRRPARRAQQQQHVAPFIVAFHEDREYLRILPAHDFPRATDFIEAMVRAGGRPAGPGCGVPGRGRLGVFRHRPFPGVRAALPARPAGAQDRGLGRVSTDEYDKENARDFVLWKAAKPEDEAVGAAWDAPFGRGRPGWHLECSAMALELIGRRLGSRARHPHRGGGSDFSASRGRDRPELRLYRKGEFARVWMHGAFLR